MANFNRIVLLGRLTRDPESRTFANGGKVAKFAIAASPSRKKNQATGKWEDDPMFIDCEVFNRGEFGKLADLVGDKCRKGSQVMIEGKLHLETWDDKNSGGKRSKHKVVVDAVQLLDRQESNNQSPSAYDRNDRPVESQQHDAVHADDIPF